MGKKPSESRSGGNGKNGSDKEDRYIMTLRIDPKTRQKLFRLCAKLSEKEGRPISMNEGVITLIREASSGA